MSYTATTEKRVIARTVEESVFTRHYTCDGCGREWETSSEQLHQYPEDLPQISLYLDFERTGLRAKHACSLACLASIVAALRDAIAAAEATE